MAAEFILVAEAIVLVAGLVSSDGFTRDEVGDGEGEKDNARA